MQEVQQTPRPYRRRYGKPPPSHSDPGKPLKDIQPDHAEKAQPEQRAELAEIVARLGNPDQLLAATRQFTQYLDLAFGDGVEA